MTHHLKQWNPRSEEDNSSRGEERQIAIVHHGTGDHQEEEDITIGRNPMEEQKKNEETEYRSFSLHKINENDNST